ncbi:MAG: hypothetical protein LRY31_01595 [Burkholderiaceae bacterium]|nr:hypothetical protein [Burkholderiaceae bacterium]
MLQHTVLFQNKPIGGIVQPLEACLAGSLGSGLLVLACRTDRCFPYGNWLTKGLGGPLIFALEYPFRLKISIVSGRFSGAVGADRQVPARRRSVLKGYVKLRKTGHG